MVTTPYIIRSWCFSSFFFSDHVCLSFSEDAGSGVLCPCRLLHYPVMVYSTSNTTNILHRCVPLSARGVQCMYCSRRATLRTNLGAFCTTRVSGILVFRLALLPGAHSLCCCCPRPCCRRRSGQGGGRAPAHALRAVQADRHRPSQRSSHVRPPGNWEDHDGEGCSQRYKCLVHQRGKLVVVRAALEDLLSEDCLC